MTEKVVVAVVMIHSRMKDEFCIYNTSTIVRTGVYTFHAYLPNILVIIIDPAGPSPFVMFVTPSVNSH